VTVVQGPVIQLAWVVADVAAAEQHLTALRGIRQWTRLPDIRFGPDSCEYRGSPADFTAHISMAYVDDLQLELIQPVTGVSIYTEFLERSGGGLHHLCFETADLDETLRSAAAQGMDVVQRGDMAHGAIRFAYLDGAVHGVPYVELAQLDDGMRAFYEAVKAAS
jgi:hypothetical protein